MNIIACFQFLFRYHCNLLQLCPHFGHVVDHLQLLVFFDDIFWQVRGEGEDRCVVLGGEAFFEAKPDGFGADF